MISATMLSYYSTLSSRILTTNHLITFLTLHSRCPVLQSINTYYSLIRAIYVFRLCALFCLCISSPSLSLNLPHVLSISHNCLAPPHVPVSPCIERSFPSVFRVHTVLSVLASLSFLLLTFLPLYLFLVSCISVLPFTSYIRHQSSSCSCFLPSVSCSFIWLCKSH